MTIDERISLLCAMAEALIEQGREDEALPLLAEAHWLIETESEDN